MKRILSSGPGVPGEDASRVPALAEELRAAEGAAREAGGIIARLYRGRYQVEQKSDGDPVTTADTRANRAIRETLAARFPDDAWLSEEDADDAGRLARERVWIVDPLDGTREFIRGIPEFCVSIGLAQHGSPVLGVVYHPLRTELFSAVRGCGARLNGEPLPPAPGGGPGRPSLLVSRSEPRRRLADLAGEFDLRPMGSIAYRMASVAGGRADAAVTFRRVREWDVCAGVAVVEAAGGWAADGRGERPAFNRPEPVLERLVAASEGARAKVRALLDRAPAP